MPDVPTGVPYVPARLEWKDGADYVYKDPDTNLAVMVPAYDPVLEDFVTRHQHGQDDSIFINGAIQVWNIDQDTWNAVDVVKQISQELHDQTNTWYEDRDTYREGATACYNDHGNPTTDTGCPDFMEDSKRIGDTHYRDDDGHRRQIPRRHQMYLCHLCPYYQSYVLVEMRRKAGGYKEINR